MQKTIYYLKIFSKLKNFDKIDNLEEEILSLMIYIYIIFVLRKS
jgi:hypothetical protein